MLHRLKDEGISILVSTPYMDEAEQCDRIALIQEGNILSIETPEAVTDHFEKRLWAIKADNKYRLIQVLRGFEHAESVQPFGEFVHYTDNRKEFNVSELREYLGNHELQNLEIKKVKPDIEDTFMRLMEQEDSHG